MIVHVHVHLYCTLPIAIKSYIPSYSRDNSIISGHREFYIPGTIANIKTVYIIRLRDMHI